jgi:hypothetical protein
MRNHLVPAFERASHFVHEHQGALASAAQLIAERNTIEFDEAHLAFQPPSAVIELLLIETIALQRRPCTMTGSR